MLVWENILLAINGLRANKTRALLTMLGIIIGISSVIAIMSIGESLKKGVNSEMGGVGANNITLMVVKREKMEEETNEEGLVFSDDTKFNKVTSPGEDDLISQEMLDSLRTEFADEIQYIELSGDVGNGVVESGRNTAKVSVKYVNEDYFPAEHVELAGGRFLSKREQERGKKVCMIAESVVDKVFYGDMNKALGQVMEVHIKNQYYSYTVVGVYKESAADAMFSLDYGSNVYIPLQAGISQTHASGKFGTITIVGVPGINVESVMKQFSNYMNDRYYKDNPIFEIMGNSMAALVDMFGSLLTSASVAISVIAGISLLVGGIGVMNIMLVSVTERTREIGTRKALGATNDSIRLQFITESVVICIIGGIIGLLLGIGIGLLAAKLMKYPAAIPASGVVLSVLFSSAIGIFFGYAPANKAAKMNPIDALRYE